MLVVENPTQLSTTLKWTAALLGLYVMTSDILNTHITTAPVLKYRPAMDHALMIS